MLQGLFASGALFCAQNDLSRSVKRDSRQSMDHHVAYQATTVQHFSFQSPEPSAIRVLWEMAMKLHTDHSCETFQVDYNKTKIKKQRNMATKAER